MLVRNRTRTRRQRRTRRWAWGFSAAVVVAFLAFQDAPFASVAPGPTPELSALVVAANTPATLDPTFGVAGKWHATTIEATPLSWPKLAWCKVRNTCDVYPLAVDSGTASQAAQSMARSVADAATVAATWTGTGDHHTVMTADMGSVGGASAGLMLTLAFVDAATDGDLTGGRVIAGTGTVNTLSEVGPIVGIQFKVRGALAAGAQVFFAPGAKEAADARKAAEGTNLEVVQVSYVADALRWLCDNGGQSTACQSPALNGPGTP